MFSLSLKIAVLLFLSSSVNCALKKVIPLKGRFPAVFTPLDDTRAINVSIIPQYAKYLRYCGFDGLVVADLAGECFNVGVKEKKKLLDAWMIAAKSHSLKIIMQVGGVPEPDVLELTRYAAAIRVDAILALPPLTYYSRTVTPKELTAFIERLAKHAKSLPIYYYSYPEITGTIVDLPAFFNFASDKVPQFKGIKTDVPSALTVSAACKLRPDQTILIFRYLLLSEAALMGYDSYSLTVANVFPALTKEIITNSRAGEVAKARRAQKKLNRLIAVITAQGEYISTLKKAMNIVTDIGVGPTRLPLTPISHRGIKNIIDILEEANIRISH